MTCPICDTPMPDDQRLIQSVTICPNPDCGRTLVKEAEGYRLAVGSDTQPLNPNQLTELRKMRNRPKRARG